METTVGQLNALNEFLRCAPSFDDVQAWRHIVTGLQRVRRARNSANWTMLLDDTAQPAAIAARAEAPVLEVA